MNTHLTEDQLRSILTEKGKEAVNLNYNLAICVNITKDKVGEKAFDSAYAFKLHDRKLENYLQSLYQMNGQVNTLISKLVHNYVAVVELIELGYLCEDTLEVLLPKLVEKFDLLVSGEFTDMLNNLPEPKAFAEYYAIHHNGTATICPKKSFKTLVKGVKSGHWEGGSPKEQIKALKEKKKASRRDWYTVVLNDVQPITNIKTSKVVLVEKGTGDGCTIFPSRNFDHHKFGAMHRDMSYNEVKLLVENKFHREKDVEWFKQFEKEVK